MTDEELCEKYQIKLSTLKEHSARTLKKIEKDYGVKIIKEGRGKNAKYYEDGNDGRAVTLYEEPKQEIVLTFGTNLDGSGTKVTTFEDLNSTNFLAMIGICATPMAAFRGTYENFLQYLGVPITTNNIIKLKGAIDFLVRNDYIACMTLNDNKTFVAALQVKAEKELHIGMSMIRTCKKLAAESGKRN